MKKILDIFTIERDGLDRIPTLFKSRIASGLVGYDILKHDIDINNNDLNELKKYYEPVLEKFNNDVDTIFDTGGGRFEQLLMNMKSIAEQDKELMEYATADISKMHFFSPFNSKDSLSTSLKQLKELNGIFGEKGKYYVVFNNNANQCVDKAQYTGKDKRGYSILPKDLRSEVDSMEKLCNLQYLEMPDIRSVYADLLQYSKFNNISLINVYAQLKHAKELAKAKQDMSKLPVFDMLLKKRIDKYKPESVMANTVVINDFLNNIIAWNKGAKEMFEEIKTEDGVNMFFVFGNQGGIGKTEVSICLTEFLIAKKIEEEKSKQ